MTVFKIHIDMSIIHFEYSKYFLKPHVIIGFENTFFIQSKKNLRKNKIII